MDKHDVIKLTIKTNEIIDLSCYDKNLEEMSIKSLTIVNNNDFVVKNVYLKINKKSAVMKGWDLYSGEILEYEYSSKSIDINPYIFVVKIKHRLNLTARINIGVTSHYHIDKIENKTKKETISIPRDKILNSVKFDQNKVNLSDEVYIHYQDIYTTIPTLKHGKNFIEVVSTTDNEFEIRFDVEKRQFINRYEHQDIYSCQNKTIESFLEYVSKWRWSSYYIQLNEILNVKPHNVLEIGVNCNILSSLIKTIPLIEYKTLDINKQNNPDYIGSVTDIPLPDKKCDVVCAFQVLEHLSFDEFETAICEMMRVSKKYVMISLPHSGRIVFHHSKQHIWEVGTVGYELDIINEYFSIIATKNHFKVEKEYQNKENEYHHFWIFKENRSDINVSSCQIKTKEHCIKEMNNNPKVFNKDERTARYIADSWSGKCPPSPNLKYIENAVPVVLSANEKFSPYLAVMLQSLLDHTNPKRLYHFIIFETDFSSNTINSLIKQVNKHDNCVIDFVNTRNVLSDIPIAPTKNYLSMDAYSRLLIPYLLNKYPKVIYLDVDMRSLIDIAELLDVNIGDYCFGAVPGRKIQIDLKNNDYGSFLKRSAVIMLLDDWSLYFNSGVLLYDTRKFIKEVSFIDLFRCAIYLSHRYSHRCHDQDVLNLLFKGNYYVLPEAWNFTWIEADGKDYTPVDKNAKIIHYTSIIKPWGDHDFSHNPDAIRYRRYAEKVELYMDRHGSDIINKSSVQSNTSVIDISKKTCLHNIFQRSKTIQKIYFINRIDINNVGDWVCSPLSYYWDFFCKYALERLDIDFAKFDHITSDDIVILGGSGMFDLRDSWNTIYNKILNKCKNVIAWSVGFNTHNDLEIPKIPIEYEKFKLIGIRDFAHPSGLPWLPCVSSLNSALDKKLPIERDYGLLTHKDYKFEISGFESISNNATFDEVTSFISSSDTILTSTYHGAFWSMLMGKKTIVTNTFSTKFDYFKYKPLKYFKNNSYSIPIGNVASSFALEEARRLNDAFFNQVKTLIEKNISITDSTYRKNIACTPVFESYKKDGV